MKRFGFTLAEILIVLVIIGALTMILLPVAFQGSPDEAVLKFKKGHNTLSTVIKELVSSDKYYQNGDLGTRANGQLLDRTHKGDIEYFCKSMSEIMTTKSVNCSKDNSKGSAGFYWMDVDVDNSNTESCKTKADELCKKRQETTGAEIVTSDNIIFFNATPAITFAMPTTQARKERSERDDYSDEVQDDTRLFGGHHVDENGFDRIYKIVCMDIDGINKGEDPFAYGIRADGKILTGKRADEWMEKSIQKND